MRVARKPGNIIIPLILLFIPPLYFLGVDKEWSSCTYPNKFELTRYELIGGDKKCNTNRKLLPWQGNSKLVAISRDRLVSPVSQELRSYSPEINFALSVTSSKSSLTPSGLKLAHRELGLSHLLVPSGLHLALVYGTFIVFRTGRFSAVIAATLFTWLIDFKLPVVRALVFLWLYVFARTFHWRLRVDSALFWFVLFLWLLSPEKAFSVGMWLTVYALVGIMIGLEMSEGSSAFIRGACVCSCAWICTSLIQAAVFQEFIVFGALANILVGWSFGAFVLVPGLLMQLVIEAGLGEWAQLFALPVRLYSLFVTELSAYSIVFEGKFCLIPASFLMISLLVLRFYLLLTRYQDSLSDSLLIRSCEA